MSLFVMLIVAFVVIQSLLLAVSVGIGFLLHWLIPGLEIGPGIVAGVIATIATTYFLCHVVGMTIKSKFVELSRESDENDDEEDEEEEDIEKDEEEVDVPAPRKRRWSAPHSIGRHWQKRKR